MGTVVKQGEVSIAQCCNILSVWAPASHLSALCLGFLNYKVESSSTHFIWLLWEWRCNHVKYLERRVVSSEEPFHNGLCKSKQGWSICVFSVLAGGSVVLGFGYGVMVNVSQELWDWAWRDKGQSTKGYAWKFGLYPEGYLSRTSEDFKSGEWLDPLHLLGSIENVPERRETRGKEHIRILLQ